MRPNPRLQRTRFAPLRSPLSRKPLGAGSLRVGTITLGLALVVAPVAACQKEIHRLPKSFDAKIWKSADALPSSSPAPRLAMADDLLSSGYLGSLDRRETVDLL